jgi:hypothetical protein
MLNIKYLLLLILIVPIQSLSNCNKVVEVKFKKLKCDKIIEEGDKSKEMVVSYNISVKEILLNPQMVVVPIKEKWIKYEIEKKKFKINLKDHIFADCFTHLTLRVFEKHDLSEKPLMILDQIFDVAFLNDLFNDSIEDRLSAIRFLIRNVDCGKNEPIYTDSPPEYFFRGRKDKDGVVYEESESVIVNLINKSVKSYEKTPEEIDEEKNQISPYMNQSVISYMIRLNDHILNRKYPKNNKPKTKKKKNITFAPDVNVFEIQKPINEEEELSDDETFSFANIAIKGAGLKIKAKEGDLLGTHTEPISDKESILRNKSLKKSLKENREAMKANLDKLENMNIGGGPKKNEIIYL